MARVVVVGGGIAGMAMALLSARRGHEVVVVDRDPGPPEGPADALAAWSRPGVVQADGPHYFLARSTRVLRESAPDVLGRLTDLGVGPSTVRFGDDLPDDRALTARRPVYESAVRSLALAEPGVTHLPGSVRGLCTDPADPDRVVGVRVREPEDTELEVHGDLVVDAGGRRTASDRWLRDAGLAPAVTDEAPCELHYNSHHLRLRPGEEYPSLDVPNVEVLPYATMLVFIGDNRTFSIATAVSSHDPLRRAVQDPEVFLRVLRACPTTAAWVDRAEPVGPMMVMAGLANRRRRLVADGRRPTPGFALVGDAALYTNPSMGQGVSLSFWMAQQLATLADRAVDDPLAVTTGIESWVADELGPRFDRQIAADRARSEQLAAGCRGEGFVPIDDPVAADVTALMVLSMQDEEVMATARRIAHLLEHPRVLDEPSLRARLDAVAASMPPGPPGPPSLPRDEFETLVTA